jgi:addiction module HigA family antidote
MKNPPHPGAFIRTEILEPLDLTGDRCRAGTRVSRPALSNLLNGQADLSGQMALRIEKAFGVRMETLMRMQSSYNVVQTRQREKLISVRRIATKAARTARCSGSTDVVGRSRPWVHPRGTGAFACRPTINESRPAWMPIGLVAAASGPTKPGVLRRFG